MPGCVTPSLLQEITLINFLVPRLLDEYRQAHARLVALLGSQPPSIEE